MSLFMSLKLNRNVNRQRTKDALEFMARFLVNRPHYGVRDGIERLPLICHCAMTVLLLLQVSCILESRSSKYSDTQTAHNRCQNNETNDDYGVEALIVDHFRMSRTRWSGFLLVSLKR